jgi:selenocysteine lyase/cysteine desulfurase
VRLLLEFGMDTVSGRILENTDFLLRNLADIDGIHVTSRTAVERRSGIVSFQHPTTEPDAIYQALRDQGISCAVREGSVRISPHFYQGENELEKLLLALVRIV